MSEELPALSASPKTRDYLVHHLHIPKTAGTTLTELLLSQFVPTGCQPLGIDPLDLLCLPDADLINLDLIYGHLPYGNYLGELTGKKVVSVTLLREPRSIIASLYKQVMQEPRDPIRPYVDANCPTFEAFVFDPVIATYIHNPQTRFLGAYDRQWDLSVIEQIRTVQNKELINNLLEEVNDRWNRVPDRRILANARQRLERCAVVGLVECFQESLELIIEQLELQPCSEVTPRNVSSIPVELEGLAPHVLRRVDELTVMDRQLYLYAFERFERDTNRRQYLHLRAA